MTNFKGFSVGDRVVTLEGDRAVITSITPYPGYGQPIISLDYADGRVRSECGARGIRKA